MRKRSLRAFLISLVALVLCPLALAQDSSAGPGLSSQPNIVEVMDWLDKNGLAQARVGIRTSSQPARDDTVPQQDAYPALSLFYSEGFKFINLENCGVILRNDNTRLISQSQLVHNPTPNDHYSAELFIPLNRLSLKKGRKPFRHTSDLQKAQLLGTWRAEFKSNRSQEDVVLTLFVPGQTAKWRVWEAETLTFTFDSKETSEKFDAAFRQAIKICQPVKYMKR
jgi:hypothetical protein